ncbi:YdcF family protein [Corynebacterium lizhenjunii]|uniref:YdcF family protein n=1 Tax=Corynebacterium lizhenjunii TaxID=2709394 RepID=A0A7T0PBG8_9CORY|nr:YdcF family protein [Corynebacterium lizhenjunii]QPK78702.1 YdcF family protein [Corynebacterium lizhenjunii]
MAAVDPIVVLGSRVSGDQPGALLEQRLLTALALARPGQPFVVTGAGESGVMRAFLEARGGVVVAEDPHATSTNENLENVRALLPEVTRLQIVTSNFHALRTRLWAWHLGIPVRVIPAPTPLRLRPRNYLREVLATPHSAVRILWRRLKAAWLG